MTETELTKAIKTYFDTLTSYGRTVNSKINPVEKIVKKEKRFLKYLDDNDLMCMFCNEHLIVIAIGYRTQRPVWGCLKDKFMKGLQKIKWLDHCADCGRKLNLEHDDEYGLEYQQKYMDADNIKSVCHKCCHDGNILEEEDMANVHKKVLTN